MAIGGAHFSQAVTLDHWRKLATTLNFDREEITDLVARLASSVAELNQRTWANLDSDQAQKLETLVSRNIEKLVS